MTAHFGRIWRNSLKVILLFIAFTLVATEPSKFPILSEDLPKVQQIESSFITLKLQLEVIRLRACISNNLKLSECGPLTPDGQSVTKLSKGTTP